MPAPLVSWRARCAHRWGSEHLRGDWVAGKGGNEEKLFVLIFLHFIFEINAECITFATETKTFIFMVTKKKYEKPSTKVYELKHRQPLLIGSNGDGNLNPMDDPTDL